MRRFARGKVLCALLRAGAVVALGACAKPPVPTPAALPPPPPAAPEVSGWPFWQAPVFDVHPRPEGREMTEELADAPWLASDEAWRAGSAAILAKVRETGIALHAPSSAETSLGRFYEARARRGAPLVITIDALFAAAHLGFASAAADVETGLMGRELSTVLHRLDARLGAEAGGATANLHEGYRVARATVAVALALSDPSYVVPVDLLSEVGAETAILRAHAGLARSPLLGVTLDYGSMFPRGPLASATDPRTGMFEAAAWLASASFLFAGKGEPGGGEVDVGTARGHARAALLLARLLIANGDAAAAASLARISKVDQLVFGEAGDLSPLDVADLARRADLDLGGGRAIADVAKLDRFRRIASRAEKGTMVPGHAGAATGGEARSMRIVPLRLPADGRLLERLVVPFVGSVDAGDASTGLPKERTLPSALDVGMWLGSPVAREALERHGDFGYSGLEDALVTLVRSRPADEPTRHASVYASWLEAIATALAPSPIESRRPESSRGRRKLRAALAAWTFLRHDALAFAHDVALPVPPFHEAGQASPLRAGSAAPRVFVEGHPRAVASLLGAVRQLHRGLAELGAIKKDSPSWSLLSELESLLALALEASVRLVNGDPSFADLEPELDRLAARLAVLEESAGHAASPVMIDVHVDRTSGRVLEEGTLPIEELFMPIRDPTTRHVLLAVGVSIPQVELEETAAHRSSDAAWRTSVAARAATERSALVEPEKVAW